jgi:hypothetical protein
VFANSYLALISVIPRLSRPGTCVSVIGALAILVSSAAQAAELTGRIWNASTGDALPGGQLTVTCPGYIKGNFPLASDGSFVLTGVPSGASCQLTLASSLGNATRHIKISAPVVRFNAEARVVSGSLMLIPR